MPTLPPAHIDVPAVGIHASMREGVGARTLARGAGHYPSTGEPGSGLTVAYAGHDVTHERTFHPLLAARRGELVYVEWQGHEFIYQITGKRVVRPTDVNVLRNVGHERLVLSTCYPPGTARFRFITFALPIRWITGRSWLVLPWG